MLDQARLRSAEFQTRLRDAGIDVAILTDEASIAYLKPFQFTFKQGITLSADEVYRAKGFQTGYRTGRSIGMSNLEAPELKRGELTILQEGMAFAVDGGISIDGELGGRIW